MTYFFCISWSLSVAPLNFYTYLSYFLPLLCLIFKPSLCSMHEAWLRTFAYMSSNPWFRASFVIHQSTCLPATIYQSQEDDAKFLNSQLPPFPPPAITTIILYYGLLGYAYFIVFIIVMLLLFFYPIYYNPCP